MKSTTSTKKSRKSRKQRKKKASEKAETSSTASRRSNKSSKSNKSSRSTKSNKSRTTSSIKDTPEADPAAADRAAAVATAKSNAAKACAIAFAALKKFPSGALNLNIGEFYRIKGDFGNEIPVVFLDKKPVPMTTESLSALWGGSTLVGSIAIAPSAPPTPATPVPTTTPIAPSAIASIESATVPVIASTPLHRADDASESTNQMSEDDCKPSPQSYNDSIQSGFPNTNGFSQADTNDYRDSNDFNDDMNEASDHTADNHTVESTGSNVTWADKAASIPPKTPRVKSGGGRVLSSLASLIAQPTILSSLQKAQSHTRAAVAAALISKQQIIAPAAAITQAKPASKPDQRKAAPILASAPVVAPPDPVITQMENLRSGHNAQMAALAKKHTYENALLQKTLASFQAQLLAAQQQNSELLAQSLSVASSSSSISTSTDMQPYSTPTRRSQKSRPMQQRSPPVNSSATAESIKRTRTSSVSSNPYDILNTVDDEDDDFFDERIDELCSTLADMSYDDLVDDTVTRVEGLSLQQAFAPASGSNGAGLTK